MNITIDSTGQQVANKSLSNNKNIKWIFCHNYLIILCFMLSSTVLRGETLIYKDEVYKYEKIPIYEKNSKKIMFYNGKISVQNSNGKDKYMNLIDYAPGCEGHFPTISIIKQNMSISPILKKQYKKNLVVFCGSTGGRHNLLQLYQPGIGMVAHLDFFDGPVNLNIDKDGVYNSRVFYNMYIKSIHSKISYSIYYQLINIGSSVTFKNVNNTLTQIYYQEYIENQIKEFELKHNLINLTQALFIAIFTNNINEYNRIFSLVKFYEKIISNQKLLQIEEELRTMIKNRKFNIRN